MAYPTKSVYPCRTAKAAFHTFIRMRKEVFGLFRNYCGLLDRNQIVRHQRILDLAGNRAVVIALCQSCEEGLTPQSIVAVAYCNVVSGTGNCRAVADALLVAVQTLDVRIDTGVLAVNVVNSLLPAQLACHHDRVAAHEEYMARVEVQAAQSTALPSAG